MKRQGTQDTNKPSKQTKNVNVKNHQLSKMLIIEDSSTKIQPLHLVKVYCIVVIKVLSYQSHWNAWECTNVQFLCLQPTLCNMTLSVLPLAFNSVVSWPTSKLKRSFNVVGPRVWNMLLALLCSVDN